MNLPKLQDDLASSVPAFVPQAFWRRSLPWWTACALLAACGGGGGGESAAVTETATTVAETAPAESDTEITASIPTEPLADDVVQAEVDLGQLPAPEAADGKVFAESSADDLVVDADSDVADPTLGDGSDGPTESAGLPDTDASKPLGFAAGKTLAQNRAAALAARLGLPQRLLVGLGSGASPQSIRKQGLRPDILDRYLVGVGNNAWVRWNLPEGRYVGVVAETAASVKAVPMVTLYQMASWGDGNLAGITNDGFMRAYWHQVRVMYQQLARTNRPAMVNLEPDFWGYVQRKAPGGDPSRMRALVRINPDCKDLKDDVTGIGGCLVRMARRYAPKAAVGFTSSTWGANRVGDVVNFQRRIGAAQADFVVLETSDRDAGCFEAANRPECRGRAGPFYWDASNRTNPSFRSHLATANAHSQGLGKPLVWWQTPLGVASNNRGGWVNHWRDNRVEYFLTHANELTAVGGMAVVFGWGHGSQTSIDTDGGQFRRLSLAYLKKPASLR